VFEMGTSLREARLRRGLTIADVEGETKIRGKYLTALENEQFDVLPAGAYAKGFLRAYAEFLGLDGDIYLDEYNERFAQEEEPIALSASRGRARGRGVGSYVARKAALLAVVVGVIAALVWIGGRTTDRPDLAAVPPATPAPADAPQAPAPQSPSAPAEKQPPPAPPQLVLAAARGDSWLSVRLGSADGKLLYEETLKQGGRARFSLKRPLWIRIGAPASVDATVGGKRARLPDDPVTLIADASGIRPAAG
jgi:cytoskeleton protein RodZ